MHAGLITAASSHFSTSVVEHSGHRMFKSHSIAAVRNRELCGIINLCLWNILNTSGSNYCCAYSHSYINICMCEISAPWHLLKWLHGEMRQTDSATGAVSQHRERQPFVNATTTSGVPNTQKPGPHVCGVGAGSENATSHSLSQGSEHTAGPSGLHSRTTPPR